MVSTKCVFFESHFTTHRITQLGFILPEAANRFTRSMALEDFSVIPLLLRGVAPSGIPQASLSQLLIRVRDILESFTSWPYNPME